MFSAIEGVPLTRLLLTDEEWELVAHVFPRDARTVLDGVLWVLRTGSPWRDLPEQFGAWKTGWRMFDTWNADGKLAKILHRLQAAFVAAGAIGDQLWCIDGTTVWAARCAAGGGKRATRRSLATTPKAVPAEGFRRKSTWA